MLHSILISCNVAHSIFSIYVWNIQSAYIFNLYSLSSWDLFSYINSPISMWNIAFNYTSSSFLRSIRISADKWLYLIAFLFIFLIFSKDLLSQTLFGLHRDRNFVRKFFIFAFNSLNLVLTFTIT